MRILLLLLVTLVTGLFAFPGEVFAQTSYVATLALDPSSGTFNRGCTFAVNIVLNTGGVDTDGTDAILLYDPSRFAGQSITNGTIYPDYPGNNIDNAAGKITISGLASVSTPFNGQGILATVNFKVVDTATTGAAQIRFDFDPQNKSKTTDSNVVQRGTVVDVLNSVVDGNYVIGTGACGAAQSSSAPTPTSVSGGEGGGGGTGRSSSGGAGTPSSGTPSGQISQQYPPGQVSQQYPTKNLPPAGLEQTTFTLAIIGGIFTVLGILGLALL